MLPPGHRPFLRAICDQPADDAPRLVFADWLDEHGDPDRAEFIRVQVALAAARGRGEEPAELVERDRDFRQALEIRWRCELPVLSGVIWQRFWRGFVSGAEFSNGRWFIKNAVAACAAAPIQFARLIQVSDHQMVRIAESAALRRFEGLTLFNPTGVEERGWRALFQSPNLAALRSLHFIGQPAGSFRVFGRLPVIGPVGVIELTNSPIHPQLREVVVRGNLEEHAAQLLRRRFGPRFRHDPLQ